MEERVDLTIEFNEMTIEAIVEGIRSLMYSCTQVLQYFLFQAKLAQQSVNCITQFLEEEALQTAKDLDRRILQGEKFPKERYPLLGLPVSIKDTIDIEGYPTVSGFKSRMHLCAFKDAQVVEIVKRCGGIPFCKTNVPQFCMSAESSNPIYGTTLNPNHKDFTPGGSSSGEAALIKFGGSILGIGSDIAGSLRIPAHFCGIYSFKPTSTRFTSLGHIKLTPGQENLALSLGPITRNVKDLEYFYKSVLLQQPWKTNVDMVPLPYTKCNIDRKLKVGYLVSDEIFPATPACRRAVLETVDMLRADGHTCTKISFDGIEEVGLVNVNLAVSDSWTGIFRNLSDEGIDKSIAMTTTMIRIPYIVKYLGSLIAKHLFGQTYLYDLLTQVGAQDVDGMFQIQNQRQVLRDNLLRVWDEQDLDVLVLPVSSIPAFKLGEFYKASASFSYVAMFNAFDMPAGVLPVTQVDPKLDSMGDKNIWIQNNLKTDIKKLGTWLQQDLYSLYEPKVMAGLPVGVQVVTKRYEDEKCLYAMQLIDKCIKANV